MKKDCCEPTKHDFRMTDSGVHTLQGELQPAVFQCTKCKLSLYASDVTGIQMLNLVRGWRSWVPLLALVVSGVALIVSIVAIVLDLNVS